MKKVFAGVLIMLSLAINSFAASAGGTTLFNFLKIPLNASQASLAGINAFNVTSAASNPAMLPFFERVSLSASYALYFQDTSFNSASLTIPAGNGGINISYGGFDYGTMDSYTEDAYGDYVKNGTFGASDAFAGLSYGFSINYEFYAGVGIKNVWQKIDDSKMSGFVFNAAVMYMPDTTWYIAGGADNAGPDVEGYKMPSSIYAAFINADEESFMYGFELRSFLGDSAWFNAACEYNYNRTLFLRAGYKLSLNNNNNSLGEWYEKNLSLGFGIEYGAFGLDYAWLPFGELGDTNMISLQIYF
jgi:hypothetical protein